MSVTMPSVSMEPLLIVLDELKIRFRDASFNLFGLHPSEPPKGFAEGHVESKHGFEFLAAFICVHYGRLRPGLSQARMRR
jgi:hypothetical protein